MIVRNELVILLAESLLGRLANIFKLTDQFFDDFFRDFALHEDGCGYCRTMSKYRRILLLQTRPYVGQSFIRVFLSVRRGQYPGQVPPYRVFGMGVAY